MIERFTPQHPRVQSVDAQIADLNSELALAEADVRQLPTTEREILSVSREVAVASDMYVNLVNRAQELQVVTAFAATRGNVRVVDYASAPLAPYRPNRSLITMLYLFMGALLAGGIILFQRQIKDTVRDPEIIEARLDLPIYATVCHSTFQASIDNKSPDSGVLAVANPTDLAIEGMRSLRTSLQFAFVNAANNILLITGPTARIGKTFVSTNLAAVLASSGRSVVVVDADLRRGSVHEQFALQREPGLADVIAGDLTIEDVTVKSNVDGLHVVPACAIPPNPSELLMHDHFVDLMKDLAAAYDHVIIDSPPVLAVTDAAVLSHLAGVVLLVAKCGAHSLREIEQSVKQLTRVGANLRGVVFNDMPAYSGHAYGQHTYGVYAPRKRVGNLTFVCRRRPQICPLRRAR